MILTKERRCGRVSRGEAVKEDEHREENSVCFCEQRADGRNAMEREIAESGGPLVRHCEGESWEV
jgi:hypothetical protein